MSNVGEIFDKMEQMGSRKNVQYAHSEDEHGNILFGRRSKSGLSLSFWRISPVNFEAIRDLFRKSALTIKKIDELSSKKLQRAPDGDHEFNPTDQFKLELNLKTKVAPPAVAPPAVAPPAVAPPAVASPAVASPAVAPMMVDVEDVEDVDDVEDVPHQPSLASKYLKAIEKTRGETSVIHDVDSFFDDLLRKYPNVVFTLDDESPEETTSDPIALREQLKAYLESGALATTASLKSTDPISMTTNLLSIVSNGEIAEEPLGEIFDAEGRMKAMVMRGDKKGFILEAKRLMKRLAELKGVQRKRRPTYMSNSAVIKRLHQLTPPEGHIDGSGPVIDLCKGTLPKMMVDGSGFIDPKSRLAEMLQRFPVVA